MTEPRSGSTRHSTLVGVAIIFLSKITNRQDKVWATPWACLVRDKQDEGAQDGQHKAEQPKGRLQALLILAHHLAGPLLSPGSGSLKLLLLSVHASSPTENSVLMSASVKHRKPASAAT